VIELVELTKRYRSAVAVDAISAVVAAGSVTGLLGPNGAGKSTTMRMIVGLDRPSSGQALVDGRTHGERVTPLREVGRCWRADRRIRAVAPWTTCSGWPTPTGFRAAGPARSRSCAASGRSSAAGLVVRRRAGRLSLGMRQRLGLAAALLGDPPVLLLDEPSNGLDPEGISWLRGFIRELSAQGRTILISSHLIAEIAEIADHVLVIRRGALLADCPPGRLPLMAGLHPAIRVRTERLGELAGLLAARGAAVEAAAEGTILVSGPDRSAVAAIAASGARS
jgi:ABC-2 type transport system ATP-binding protein